MKAGYTAQPEHAYGFERNLQTWGKVDISQPINLLLKTYHEIEVGVETMGREYTLYSKLFLSELMNFQGTLQQWLDTKEGIALPQLKDGYPVLEFVEGRYQSLYCTLDVSYQFCPPNYNPNASFAMEQADDIIINPKDNHKEWLDWMLYNVGGAWVRSVNDPWGIRLVGAGGILQRLNSQDVSFYDFKPIGKVSFEDITETKIVKVSDDHSWYTNLQVGINEDLTGKTVGIVIGGVLTWIPAKQINGSNTFTVNLSNYALINNLQYQANTWDWTEIGLNPLAETNKVADVINDETLHKLLIHKSTFVVLVDNPYLEFEKLQVSNVGSYRRFYHFDSNDIDSKKPLGYLVNIHNHGVYYWPTWEEGRWCFHTKQRATPKLVSRSVKWHKDKLINDQRTIADLVAWDDAYLTMVRIKARKK